MNSCKALMMASHTSATNCYIACLEILKVYMRLVKESSLARKRRVAASLMDGEIDCLNLVLSFDILLPMIFKTFQVSRSHPERIPESRSIF
jgi:hypothetical protein